MKKKIRNYLYNINNKFLKTLKTNVYAYAFNACKSPKSEIPLDSND